MYLSVNSEQPALFIQHVTPLLHSVFLPPSHPVLLILLTFTVLEIALYSENINSSLAKLANLISVLPFFFEKNLFLLSLRPRMCIFPVYLDKLILSAEFLSKS